MKNRILITLSSLFILIFQSCSDRFNNNIALDESGETKEVAIEILQEKEIVQYPQSIFDSELILTFESDRIKNVIFLF
ncbi:MAG: hypothetical protein PHH37_13925 [Paludibacter sp.]|nr:hypothetical protein [Paludibacter sp.]